MTLIDSQNFKDTFDKLLRNKKGDNIVTGRYDLESLKINDKILFIFEAFIKNKDVRGITYNLLYWEKDGLIKGFLDSKKKENYLIFRNYSGEAIPGEILLDQKEIEFSFFQSLLINHFNHELALEPSINLRVQICINYKNKYLLLDIYDDRGFDIYYSPQIDT